MTDAKRTDAPDRPGWLRSGALRALLVVIGAFGVLVVGLLVGGGEPQAAVSGLSDPGPITGWGLPIATLVMDLTAAMTVGALLLGVLLPARKGVLGKAAVRAARAGSTTAWVWAAAAAVVLLLTLSDFAGTPPHQTDYQGWLAMFIADTAQGRALAVVIVLAVIVAAIGRGVRSLNGVALVLVIALAALLPPALSGHSASAADHDLATSSLVVHVVAVSLWVGGLYGLVCLRPRSDTQASSVVAQRFSAVALWAFGLAGLSGLLNAYVRLGALQDFWQTRYGWLVLGKLAFLIVLGGFGYWHRRHTLPALKAGRPYAFARFAGVEVAVMASTIGLAVALSRTPPPVPQDLYEDVTGAEALIGFSVPPIDFTNLATLWRPDAVVVAVAALAVFGYVGGLRRLRARGIAWPIGRSIAWFAGVSTGLLVTVSGVATYTSAMFSVHMVQHMTLSMLVPILLAMGAPITLALRALPARPAVADDRTARAWILELLHSRPARLVTHPVVALTLYVLTLYAFYFSGLFELVMRSHTAHHLMIAHFVLVGSLYFWPIIGMDPMPRKLPPAGRMGLLFASLPFHAFFGVIVMMSATVIGASWYALLDLPWVDPVADQNVGGGLAWAVSEVPVLIVMGVVFVAWYRSEARAARRADRHGEADLEDYNAMLSRLAARDRVS